MSLELTENKSNIGSGALNDLMCILYCRAIGQWLPTSRQSVGDQLGNDRQPIGDRSATVSLAFVFDCRKSAPFWRSAATDRRLVGDQSATKNCVGIVCNRCNWSAISRQPVGDQSATCRRPPKTCLRPIWSQRGFTCSNQNLLATKSSLLPSATGRRSVANLLATALPCNLPATTRHFGRKEVADRLQAVCDRGYKVFKHWACVMHIGPVLIWFGPLTTRRYASVRTYSDQLNYIHTCKKVAGKEY